MQASAYRVWIGGVVWGLSTLACDAAVDSPQAQPIQPQAVEPRQLNEQSRDGFGESAENDPPQVRNPEVLCRKGLNVILGTPSDDVLVGTEGDDCIVGRAGNDVIRGGAGNDVLIGGAGNDFLRGGDGNDRLRGEAGHDSLMGENGNDDIKGGLGNDHLVGGPGNDVLVGGRGDDRLVGGEGADVLEGGGGNDVLVGAATADLIRGGAGNDLMMGVNPSDTKAPSRAAKRGTACRGDDCKRQRPRASEPPPRYVQPRQPTRSRFRDGRSSRFRSHRVRYTPTSEY
jgi:hypothetical protein